MVQMEASEDVEGFELLLKRAGVFARMSPDDKRLLVELLGEGAVGADGSERPGLGHHVGEHNPVLACSKACAYPMVTIRLIQA